MDNDIKLILMDIHNALLTIQVILLSPDMSKELNTGLHELAIKQLDNNRDYMSSIISQNLQPPERKE